MSDFIFTTHARARLKERRIPESTAERVIEHPDRTEPGKKPGTVKFIRTIDQRNVQLVGTYLTDQKKWLILSAWVRGEEDRLPLVWRLLTAPIEWLIKKVFR